MGNVTGITVKVNHGRSIEVGFHEVVTLGVSISNEPGMYSHIVSRCEKDVFEREIVSRGQISVRALRVLW